MSRNTAPTLHIEWSPTWVNAVDVATGQRAGARDLTELSTFLAGRRQALVGVARQLVFLKVLRLPKAAPEDLRRILSVQIGQFFPLPPDQLSFDFVQTHDITSEGCLTLIGAMRSEDLKQLRAELQTAGLVSTHILPVSLGTPAVAAAVGAQDALVIERSAGGLSLDIVQGGIVRFSRVVSRNSDPQTEAQRTLAAAGADDLTLVTAGGLTLPEELSDPQSSLDRLDKAPPFAFELLEERVREAAQRVARRTRLAVLMLLAALLLVVVVWDDRGDAQAVVRRGEGAWARELGKLRSIRREETGKAQRLVRIQTTLQSAFAPAQPLSDVITVIGDSLPPGAWMTGISAERGKPLQIRGTARSSEGVARFVDALAGNPRFRDVKLAFANGAKIEETPVVQFQITAHAIGNLPMPAPEKKRATRRTTTSSSAERTETGQ